MYDLHKKHGKKQRIWTCVKNMYTNNKYSSKTAVPDCVISVKLVTIAWRDRVTYNECTCIPGEIDLLFSGRAGIVDMQECSGFKPPWF